MKTTKIVMGMAAAAVMALSLTGCIMPGKSLGFTEIKVDGKNNSAIGQIAKGTIDFTNNDPNKYCRGIQLFSNKKKGITTKIELQNLTENTSNPGVMGIAFDFTQNKDKTYNFCLFGMKNNVGHIQAYVTYYKNVAEEDFTKENFGKPIVSGVADTDEQKDITGWVDKNSPSINESNGFVQLNGFTISNNSESLVVEIEALNSTATSSVNEEEIAVDAKNAYNVRIYEVPEDGNLTKFNDLSNKKAEDKTTITSTAKAELAIPRAKVDATTDKAIQAQMGFYANVYGGKTLTGEWIIADMKHDPNVAKTASDNDSFIKLNF